MLKICRNLIQSNPVLSFVLHYRDCVIKLDVCMLKIAAGQLFVRMTINEMDLSWIHEHTFWG
jgi:hypothetical protein